MLVRDKDTRVTAATCHAPRATTCEHRPERPMLHRNVCRFFVFFFYKKFMPNAKVTYSSRVLIQGYAT